MGIRQTGQTYPLICFLNAVVSYDVDDCDCAENVKTKFSEVEILNPYDSSEPFTNEKQGILDIRAKDSNTHEWIDLEVQLISTAISFSKELEIWSYFLGTIQDNSKPLSPVLMKSKE